MATSKSYKKPKSAFNQEDVELASMVKRANERLRALERKGLQNSPAYKAVERLAFRTGKLMGKTKSDELKFTTNIRKLSFNERSQLRHEVKTFLNADTSTIKGVKKVVEKVIPAYKERFSDVDFGSIDLEEALNIWNSSIVHQFSEMYGSELTSDAVNDVITNFSSQEEMEKFLEDQYGKPWSEVDEELKKLTSFNPAKNENLPWDWNDIFGDGV